MKISNKQAQSYVDSKISFNANNLHAEKCKGYYVVYSYGYWPLYALNLMTGQWYENTDKYSVSTSRHKNQSRPLIPDSRFIKMNREELVTLILG